MYELTHYINAFRSLHTAKVKGLRAPHKAVLLLAIIDLVEEDMIKSPQISLSDVLEEKFHAVWNRYLGTSAIFTPDIAKPFFHMQHEPFWRLVAHDDLQLCMAAEPGLYVAPYKVKKDLPMGSYSLKAMRASFAYAEIDGMLFNLLQNADARAMLRVVLINEYLSNHPTKTLPNITKLLMSIPLLALVA